MLKGPETRAGMTCENTETLVYAGFVTVSERGSHVSNYLCALFIVNRALRPGSIFSLSCFVSVYTVF